MSTTTTVPSRSQKGLTYAVTRWAGGQYSCSCPGYQFGRHCWHCEYVALLDALDDADRALRARPQPARISEAGRALQSLLDV